jgi:hypothetical protein
LREALAALQMADRLRFLLQFRLASRLLPRAFMSSAHCARAVSAVIAKPTPSEGIEVGAAPRNPQRRLTYRRAITPR